MRRGYKSISMEGVIVSAEDLREFVFCPYTILTRYIDGVNIKPPKRYSLDALHKVHYIIHRFGIESAYRVVVAAKQTNNKKILNFLKELLEIIEAHKKITPSEDVFENINLTSQQLGLTGKIPMIRDGLPTIEYFKINEEKGEIPLWDKILLSAYALLLEYHDERDVNYGIVEYVSTSRELKIEITEELRDMTFRYLHWMIRTMRSGRYPMKYTIDPLKCNKCLYRNDCQYK